ncbi:MAG: hypothetical protein PHP00_06745 [Thiotrichaceae bacterium]|nr:hypothetical protein [Thiotrichaceae bacterium]
MCEANVFFSELANSLSAKLGEQTKPVIEDVISDIRKTWQGEEVYITSHTSTDARVAALRTDMTRAMQEIARQYGITPKHAKALYRGRPRKNAPPEEQDELFP